MLRTGLIYCVLFLFLSLAGYSGQTNYHLRDVTLQKTVYQRTLKLMGSRFDLTVVAENLEQGNTYLGYGRSRNFSNRKADFFLGPTIPDIGHQPKCRTTTGKSRQRIVPADRTGIEDFQAYTGRFRYQLCFHGPYLEIRWIRYRNAVTRHCS